MYYKKSKTTDTDNELNVSRRDKRKKKEKKRTEYLLTFNVYLTENTSVKIAIKQKTNKKRT